MSVCMYRPRFSSAIQVDHAGQHLRGSETLFERPRGSADVRTAHLFELYGAILQPKSYSRYIYIYYTMYIYYIYTYIMYYIYYLVCSIISI